MQQEIEDDAIKCDPDWMCLEIARTRSAVDIRILKKNTEKNCETCFGPLDHALLGSALGKRPTLPQPPPEPMLAQPATAITKAKGGIHTSAKRS